jgi:hypothetical protein
MVSSFLEHAPVVCRGQAQSRRTRWQRRICGPSGAPSIRQAQSLRRARVEGPAAGGNHPRRGDRARGGVSARKLYSALRRRSSARPNAIATCLVSETTTGQPGSVAASWAWAHIDRARLHWCAIIRIAITRDDEATPECAGHGLTGSGSGQCGGYRGVILVGVLVKLRIGAFFAGGENIATHGEQGTLAVGDRRQLVRVANKNNPVNTAERLAASSASMPMIRSIFLLARSGHGERRSALWLTATGGPTEPTS